MAPPCSSGSERRLRRAAVATPAPRADRMDILPTVPAATLPVISARRPFSPNARLGTGRPVSQYAGIEGCTGWPVPSLMHRRRVLGDRIRYVGLDVHKEGIVVAVAEGGLRGEGRDYGRVANTPGGVGPVWRDCTGQVS